MDELRGKLAAEIMNGVWSDLLPHAERGAVFIVGGEIDILDVAYAVAGNDVDAISAWLTDQVLLRPKPEQIQAWDNQANGKAFRFIIVQPYVLIQELAH